MGSWIEARDVPWAARRLTEKARQSALPLRGHLMLTGLRARLATSRGPEWPQVRDNVQATLGGQPGYDVDWIVRRYHEFARLHSLVDRLPALRGFDDPDTWPLAGRDHLDAALAEGRGVLLCISHLGWYLLVAPILRVHGYDALRTAGPYFEREQRRAAQRLEQGSRLYRFLEPRTRTRAGLSGPEDITVKVDVRPILDALARERIVLLAGDGRHSQQFRSFPLLGRPYAFPTGFAKVAETARCPILPVFGLEGERAGSIRVEIRSPLAGSGAGWEEILTAYVRVLDEQLRETPHLWPRWEIEDLFEERRVWAETEPGRRHLLR